MPLVARDFQFVCAVSAFFSKKRSDSEEFVKLNCRVSGSRRAGLAMTLVVLAGVIALRTGSRVPALAGTTQAEESGFADLAGTSATVEKAAEKGSPEAIIGQVPLSFEPNRGQTDAQVKFVAHGVGYGLFLTADEAVLKLRPGRRQDAGGTSVRMGLVGARGDAEVRGMEELSGKSNYFIGNDPAKWQRDVPQFARVRYRGVYPGVDLVYYGNQRQLEYDFEVAPGADPGVIQLRFDGSKKLSSDRGDLVVETGGGNLRLHAPVVYQRIGSERREVGGRFVVGSGNRVRFAVGAYDRTKTLVIDPVLNYSSYLGGSGAESGATVAVDAAFNYYVTGATQSADFPPQPGVLGSLKGTQNVFVTKFNANNGVVFSTYLGGNGTDASVGIAVDPSFNVFVAGNTTSTNFPMGTSFAPFQGGPPTAGTHVFVSRLSADGASLPYSSYLFGSGTDTASGVAADNALNAFVTGTTTSTSVAAGFPATVGAFQTSLRGTPQFFMSKVNTNAAGGASMAYSTYFGGGNPASGIATGGGIAVDSSGNVYITGGTNFQNVAGGANNFPILNAAHACLNDPTNPASCAASSAQDVFVAKIHPFTNAAQLLYSTYLGGNGDDLGTALALDASGNAYITGSTASTNFPTTAGAVQTAFQGGASDAFVAKLNNPTSGVISVTYSTYLGGGVDDVGNAIAVDATQGARVAGTTNSTSFPAAALTSTNFGPTGGGDAFVARIDTTGAANGQYASLLGGTVSERGTGIAVDTNGVSYVAGDTGSGDFPVVTPFQATFHSPSEAFVAKVGPTLVLTTTVAATPNPVGLGNAATFTYTIKNPGTDTVSGVFFIDTLPTSGATAGAVTASPGTCTSPSGGQVVCSIGTLAANGTATVTVTLTPTTAGSLANSGRTIVTGSSFSVSAGASIPVTDFSIAVTPSPVTVQAGVSATYQVQVSPVPTFPNSISLTCSGLPAGAACTFSTTPVTITNNSPSTSTLTISTTARPVGSATTSLFKGSRVWYAVFLPISGLAFAGFGAKSRRKRVLMVLLLGVVLCGIVTLAACGGGGKSSPNVNQGTPAGSYPITITGTSGNASHATTTVLVVQ